MDKSHRDTERKAEPLRIVSPIHKAKRQLQEHMREASLVHGIEPHQGHLLSYTTLYGPCPVSELSRVFGLAPSTLTGTLDRLEGSGLVAREPNPEDRRSFLIATTPEGARIATELRSLLEDLERDVQAEVSARDMKGFEAVMRAIGKVTRIEIRPTQTENQS